MSLLRKVLWALMLPVPNLLFFPLLFWISLVMPFSHTMPTYRKLKKKLGPGGVSCLWFMWHDAGIRRRSLVAQLTNWPKQWGRHFGKL
jgi:hypothetical protein